MLKTQVNPWAWQDKFQFSQAWRVDQPRSVVFLAGQSPVSAEGEMVAAGDFDGQVRQIFANLCTVLEHAGATFNDVVKVTVYLTDISKLRDYERVVSELVAGGKPAATALEVRSLAVPGMMIEVDAIAVL